MLGLLIICLQHILLPYVGIAHNILEFGQIVTPPEGRNELFFESSNTNGFFTMLLYQE